MFNQAIATLCIELSSFVAAPNKNIFFRQTVPPFSFDVIQGACTELTFFFQSGVIKCIQFVFDSQAFPRDLDLLQPDENFLKVYVDHATLLNIQSISQRSLEIKWYVSTALFFLSLSL